MIRPATQSDLPRVLEIYRAAREIMRQSGNSTQWGTHYPPKEMIQEDIQKGQLYVICEEDEIQGVFAFILGDEPTYAHMEGGAWLDESPYGTMHRLAGDGKTPGLFAKCLAFCKTQCPHLRADTHAQNHRVQHLLEAQGFQRLGQIHVADGSPRVAYELILFQSKNSIKFLL